MKKLEKKILKKVYFWEAKRTVFDLILKIILFFSSGLFFLILGEIFIEILKEQLAYIEENCCGNNLKSASLGSEANFQSDEIKAQLSQNVPNPFNQTTKINCTIPSESGSANLYIYNMQGIQLQHHKINGTGEQCVVVSAESLNPGVYLYSLVIDGKEIDTKKMMLTE
jgi:hypothetical protein